MFHPVISRPSLDDVYLKYSSASFKKAILRRRRALVGQWQKGGWGRTGRVRESNQDGQDKGK